MKSYSGEPQRKAEETLNNYWRERAWRKRYEQHQKDRLSIPLTTQTKNTPPMTNP
ncbi:MAG: hypothetical protein IBX56_16855 [Methylomicrobium sp.]|nr:hypothetical protein [Methylomicrobium sp.]